MLHLALVCSALIGDLPAADDLKDYRAAAAHVGRDAEAHVKLALWCESHDLGAERLKHLAIAVLTDPANATARGLMGLVAYHGKWQRPDAVADQVKADEATAAALAEYNDRRARTPNNVDAQWKLALWCEEQGLKAEATAHLAAVVRLDPSREAAWKRHGIQEARWPLDVRSRRLRKRRPRPIGRSMPTSTGARSWRSGADGCRTRPVAARPRAHSPRSSIRAPCRRSGPSSPPAPRIASPSPSASSARSTRPGRRGRWRSWPSSASRTTSGGPRPRRSPDATCATSPSCWSASCTIRSSTKSANPAGPAPRASCSSRGRRPTSSGSTGRRKNSPCRRPTRSASIRTACRPSSGPWASSRRTAGCRRPKPCSRSTPVRIPR